MFGAASLTTALQDLGDAYSKETSVPVCLLAASSTLAKQIENGSPADIFFSADRLMDYLQEHKLIQVASRSNALGNRLVLVAPLDSKVRLKIQPHLRWRPPSAAAAWPRVIRPRCPWADMRGAAALAVPGRAWDEIAAHLVPADSVRSALAFVDRGEVPLGIVYEDRCFVQVQERAGGGCISRG